MSGFGLFHIYMLQACIDTKKFPSISLVKMAQGIFIKAQITNIEIKSHSFSFGDSSWHAQPCVLKCEGVFCLGTIFWKVHSNYVNINIVRMYFLKDCLIFGLMFLFSEMHSFTFIYLHNFRTTLSIAKKRFPYLINYIFHKPFSKTYILWPVFYDVYKSCHYIT